MSNTTTEYDAESFLDSTGFSIEDAQMFLDHMNANTMGKVTMDDFWYWIDGDIDPRGRNAKRFARHLKLLLGAEKYDAHDDGYGGLCEPIYNMLDELREAKKPAQSRKITIKYHRGYDEYRVPSPDGSEAGAAYTNDKQDAIGTAKAMHGDHVAITFRKVEEW